MGSIYYRGPKRIQNRKFPIILLLLDLLVVTFFFGKNLTKSSTREVLGKEDVVQTENIPPVPILPTLSTTPINFANPSIPLERAVQDALIGSNGSYGIIIKNLKTGEYYFSNEHLSFSSASLYKLWVMAETFRQIENGTLNENDILSSDYKTLNSEFGITPENKDFESGPISLSVKNALNKMITISDNYAAYLLTHKVKVTNIASFLQANGFTESIVGTNTDYPTVTASDIALFFEKLYNKQLINDQYSNMMLELLKSQKLNSKIPKYLPDTSIAHKTGELDKYTHDAGIVYTQSGDYIIVILSKSDNPGLAKNRISDISESVYGYFTRDL
jgi:beta-lactamase class A